MNKYQLIAFGGFALVGLTYIVASLYGLSVVWMIVIILLIGAVLTLRTSWWLLASMVEIVFKVMAAIGHITGIIGDEVVDWCKGRKASLRSGRVPSWEDLASDRSPSGEPEESSYLDGVLARQN